MLITLTTPQYAKIKKCSRQAVLKAAKENKLNLLPGVIKIKKVGRFHLLEMSKI